MKKNLLAAKMKIYGDIQSNLAEAIGISTQTFNKKLNGTDGAEFSESEIRKIKKRYNLTPEELDEIFLIKLYLVSGTVYSKWKGGQNHEFCKTTETSHG